eukprot:837516_1
MSDPALLTKAYILRALMAALQKVPMDVTPLPRVIRIVISKEEEDAVDKLHKYSSKLSDLEKEMKLSNDALSANIDKCAQDIQILFNDLLEGIGRKKEEFVSEFNDICVYQRGQMSDKLNAMTGERQTIEHAMNECDNLQNDANMDRNIRCDKVMNIVNGVMNG